MNSGNDETEFGLLAEKDYLNILDTLGHLYSCRSREGFGKFCEDRLMPFMNMQYLNYGWTDEKFNIQRLEQMGDFYVDPEMAMKSISLDPMNQLMFTQARPVVAHDVDVPMAVCLKAVDPLLQEYPEMKKVWDDLRGGLAMMDFPHSNFGMGMLRLVDMGGAMTRWEVRVMELLRPHIFQALKTILLNEELARYKSITEKLADVARPIAVIGLDSRVVFSNRAFQELEVMEPGYKLPADWNRKIESTVDQFHVSGSLTGLLETPCFTVADQEYLLTVNSLEMADAPNGQGLLVQLETPDNFRGPLQKKMQEAGLTGREKELCLLIRDGFDDQEIGDRLFISVHTVATHVKNIYRKFDVKARPKLMAALNPGAE